MTEENLKLKRVTGGKYHNRSLVFHFEKDDLNHEFQIKRIHGPEDLIHHSRLIFQKY